ncbi:iron-sulfur cluster assembly accessory protein [Pleomorphomonas oryzae]|uniref:iron-sulfur cluster assembly accessory protein n=1 Tax=Pleomorphomonas oryzae TaxID=261934 RepID=UPI0004267BFE|nr:iron-sulfur cluster assembly accessory protein [Pleomorphomonas oryzae]
MIELTESAANAVRAALAGAGEHAEGLRIVVEAGGCAGLQYRMGLEKDERPGDLVLEQSGIRLYLDALTQRHVPGLVVDFVNGIERSGFVFDNPNAASRCSCGKSFC